jgi:hypothetical protein
MAVESLRLKLFALKSKDMKGKRKVAFHTLKSKSREMPAASSGPGARP